MEFSRQEYWSGLPFPSPGDLPDPGVQPGSPASPADSLPAEPPGKNLILWGSPGIAHTWEYSWNASVDFEDTADSTDQPVNEHLQLMPPHPQRPPGLSSQGGWLFPRQAPSISLQLKPEREDLLYTKPSLGQWRKEVGSLTLESL